MAYATRCYGIVPTNDNAATVRLWALTSQLNGLGEANLNVYRYAGADWQKLTDNASTGNDGGSYSYAQADTPGFSEFLLSGISVPTAVVVNDLPVVAVPANWIPPVPELVLLIGSGTLIKRSGK